MYGKYRVNKIHIEARGFASPDMNFIDPIFFRIRTIVHCVTNNPQHIKERKRKEKKKR
jgi:hypothetical protein